MWGTGGRRVQILSQRNLRQDVSRCSGYEFEDVICGLEGAAILAPGEGRWRAPLHRGRRWLARHGLPYRACPGGAARTPLPGLADLFVACVQKPVELLDLDAVPDWRTGSRQAVCVIEEIWPDTESLRPVLRDLDRFDLIACAFACAIEPLRRITGRPVIHMPGAADLLRFAPDPPGASRGIDLYAMGRRRPALHDALQARLEARGAFYHYDSATRPPIAADPALHRRMLANLLRHTSLFLVDLAKNGHADQKGQVAWGPRYVEGMAAGAVPVGHAPDTPDFARHFDWPEAVARLPDDPARAARAVCDLLDDPAALDRRRAVNLVQALARHDWLHRWEGVLGALGLPPTSAMGARRAALKVRAEAWGAVAEPTGAERRLVV